MIFFNLKIVFLTLLNLSLLITIIIGFNDYSRKEKLILEQKPIKVEVIEIIRRRSYARCVVKYNNVIFENISIPKNLKKGEFNNNDFYYDEYKNEVFSSNTGQHVLKVIFFMLTASLFLWFVPKEKFKW